MRAMYWLRVCVCKISVLLRLCLCPSPLTSHCVVQRHMGQHAESLDYFTAALSGLSHLNAHHLVHQLQMKNSVVSVALTCVISSELGNHCLTISLVQRQPTTHTAQETHT